MTRQACAFWLTLPISFVYGCGAQPNDQASGGTTALGGAGAGTVESHAGSGNVGGARTSDTGGTGGAGGRNDDGAGGVGAGGAGSVGGAGAGGAGSVGGAGVGSTGSVGGAGAGGIGAGASGGRKDSATGGAGGRNTIGSDGGTSASGGSSDAGGGNGGAVVLPPANAKFDYQIGGAYPPPSGVQIVSRDRHDPPAAGIYNICYVNGFQIQPGEEDWWQSSHPDLILRDANGNPVVDSGWDEMLVDTSTAAKRTALAAVVGAWIAKCAADGYDAVEIDNLDSYSRSKGLLTQAGNVALMALLSQAAHANGLAIGQKNSSELVANKDQMGTDFVIAEECNEYSECGDYKAGYGNLVFVIEYNRSAFTKGCSQYPELSIVLRDVSVTPNGTYDAC